MDITSWIYDGAIYCDGCEPSKGCADDHCLDSACCPQPVFSSSDEADTPQHCSVCNAFLQNALTSYGLKWLRKDLCSPLGNEEVRAEWRSFYGLDNLREWPTLKSQASAACLQEVITQRMRGIYGLYGDAVYPLSVGHQESDLGRLSDAFATAGNTGFECCGEKRLMSAEVLAKFLTECLTGAIVEHDGVILDGLPQCAELPVMQSDKVRIAEWKEAAKQAAVDILQDDFSIEVVV